MPIIIIDGPQGSGKTSIAVALRNNCISNGRGALLVDEDQDGELRPLLEKIIVGVALPPEGPVDAGDVPWKPEPSIIVVGKKAKILDKFEKIVPGFNAKFGPVYRVKTSHA